MKMFNGIQRWDGGISSGNWHGATGCSWVRYRPHVGTGYVSPRQKTHALSVDFVPNTLVIEDFITGDLSPEPRLASPTLPTREFVDSDRHSLPLLLYLPGIDGSGLAASKQFPSLMKKFNLMTFVTPRHNRTPYKQLVEQLAQELDVIVSQLPVTVPVYLLGESFGGILALSLAAKCPGIVDRVVLVNPATSFTRTLWPLLGPALLNLPEVAYSALPLALAPVLGNPINLILASLDGLGSDASVVEQSSMLLRGAFQLLDQLPHLAELLPRDTLQWKLELLRQGCKDVENDIAKVQQRVFILIGEQDLLIPSKEEGERLQRILPRSHIRVENGRSHALLQEGGVDLVSILEEEGLYVSERRLSSLPRKRNKNVKTFGTAEPVELPTDIELARYTEKLTSLTKRLTSPVFISTHMDGMKTLGLGGLPLQGTRPILFVGNHQTMALDMGVMFEEILREKNMLLRGLAHPAIFSSERNGTADHAQDTSSSSDDGGFRMNAIPTLLNTMNGRSRNQGGDRNTFESFLTEFGAVKVGPLNFSRLLSNNEAVLLYPGGAREAYRKKGEEYQIFWPHRSEFVRMAAKYDAIIVPFAAVGVDDSLNMLLDKDEISRIPFIGDAITRNADRVPSARRGVNAQIEAEEAFVSPLALPRLPPNRLYYYFKQPIQTSKADVEDRDRCQMIYEEVRESVESGIAYLLEKRESDPYKDFNTRVMHEISRGGSVKAPTFDL